MQVVQHSCSEMRSQFTTTCLSTWPLPGANSAQALADAIRVNKTVTAIDLSNTNVGDDGLKARAPRRGPLLRGRGMVGEIMVKGGAGGTLEVS